ncbi:hypothetical protein J2W22_000370 [Sphingomonas kyeonggiensis]|nr:hypothetical protein [Sphingomonas kyeonggiensis]MDQ0248323.1 hypothetical protein [Sphingomonas kyeonggiensis]
MNQFSSDIDLSIEYLDQIESPQDSTAAALIMGGILGAAAALGVVLVVT